MSRKALICLLIGVTAVAVIVGTAVVRGGDSPPARVAEHATPLAPGITNSLLNETEMRTIVGDNAFVITSFTGRLGETPANVDPAVCEGVSTIAAPGTFLGVDWQAARVMTGTSPKGQAMHYAAEGLIALSSPDAVRAYLNKIAQAWQSCDRQQYTISYSDGSKANWAMSPFVQSDTTLVVRAAPVDSKWACQHMLKAESQYVVDALVCGYDISDQARTAATQIADKLRKNMQAL